MPELLSGNAALARGAFAAGVVVATGYPGTPSTEILENLVKLKDGAVPPLYCEWAPNEKVALEVAAGAALAGGRAICTMKHVGLNVAADPLMTLAYIGAVGGIVIIVADDPGMHSSQNEQDTRQFARFAKVPLLEPADSQEAYDFMRLGLELSEQFTTPVILRTTTRVSHSRSLVTAGARVAGPVAVRFEKDPPRFVPIPLWARVMRTKLEERLAKLQAFACGSSANRIEWAPPLLALGNPKPEIRNPKGGTRPLGIITSSIAYHYVKDAFPEASVLKLGFSFPFPDELIRTFATRIQQAGGRLVVVEELDDFLEEHIKALGIACEGRAMDPHNSVDESASGTGPPRTARGTRGTPLVPGIGELSPARLAEIRAKMEGKTFATPVPVKQAADLPARPPVLCPGCPHRAVFHALAQMDVVVTGDIGCYSLGCSSR